MKYSAFTNLVQDFLFCLYSIDISSYDRTPALPREHHADLGDILVQDERGVIVMWLHHDTSQKELKEYIRCLETGAWYDSEPIDDGYDYDRYY